ncbi:hypothetical protein [Phaffia rhodozyma]|uniref:DNA replication factor Cdt1 C-terminal domain-containing protein n=1 Tax=Phaffia rhodozyma TaxID=264483 RepID=A0A0F7SRP6_PHARH|nr:hypothetical protein [Phaffia rhodozyma]
MSSSLTAIYSVPDTPRQTRSKRRLSPEPECVLETPKRSKTSTRSSALPTPPSNKHTPSSTPSLSITPSSPCSPVSTPRAKKRVAFSSSTLPPSPASTTSCSSSPVSCLSSPSVSFRKDDPSLSPSSSTCRASSLPSSLHSLLLLHRSLSLTLSLHLAQHPPVLPPRSVEKRRRDPFGLEEEAILFKGIANFEGFSGIRETVENGAQRKFALEDLRRLVWLWEWDGRGPPFKSSEHSDSDGPMEAARSSLCDLSITPARTLSKQTRTITYTYGFNLLINHSSSTGGVIGAIGRWSAQQNEREAEFKNRLERFANLCENEGREVRPVPKAWLESLPKARIGAGIQREDASPCDGSALSASTSSAATSSPRKLLFPSKPISSAPTSPCVEPTTPTSAAARRQALRDRIAAKSQSVSLANASSAALFASAGITSLLPTSAIKSVQVGGKGVDMEGLKRRSMLSRLGNVAEAAFMLFTSSSVTSLSSSFGQPSSSALGGGGQRRKAMPIEDVARVLVKSSKVEVSFAEALQSLHLLLQLCPFFLTSCQLNGEEYVEMPSSSSGLKEVKDKIKRELED